MEDVEQVEYESNILEIAESDVWLIDDDARRVKLAKGWLAYKALHEEQAYMKKIHQDMCVLSQCFARFPILKSLELSSDYDPPTEEMARMLADTYAVEGNMLDGENMTDDDEVGVAALTTLLSAASGMQKKLDSLTAHRVHWSFFNAAPKGMNFYRPAFTYLRHLNLTLEADYDDMDEEDVVQARHAEFGIALRDAANLETLSLNFGDGDVPPESIYVQRQLQVPVIWDKLAKNITWKNLISLELHIVTVSQPSLLDFLARHAETLKCIKWHSMWLTDSNVGWDVVFRMMRKSMKLQVVKFEGTWGGEGEQGRVKTLKMIDHGDKLAKFILSGSGDDGKKGRKHERRLRKSASDGMVSSKVDLREYPAILATEPQ